LVLPDTPPLPLSLPGLHVVIIVRKHQRRTVVRSISYIITGGAQQRRGEAWTHSQPPQLCLPSTHMDFILNYFLYLVYRQVCQISW
ncbi:hypothetical protein RRG08_050293, partial [Elysia crispata]